MSKIKVIGVDPAPVKDSTVFDGEKFQHLGFEELKVEIDRLAKLKEHVLICWDAPLLNTTERKPPYFKEIEKTLKKLFYTGANKKKKGAEGVSVLPFGTCPHWTISRYILGLPRFSSYDSEDVPFKLLESDDEKCNIKHSVLEVHPAVGLYYWSDKKLGAYKNSKPDKIKQVWDIVKEHPALIKQSNTEVNPKNDDELDALMAFMMGKLWVESDEWVKLYGNPEIGGMLLPRVNEIDELFYGYM